MEISLDQLFQREMEQLSRERGRVPDPDSWRWSPFDIRKFDVMLHVAYEYLRASRDISVMPISIAEAGSGIGTKLYLAKHKYGMEEAGYENDDDYLDQASKLGVRAYKCDLADMDNQPIWSVYDIVYTARPFKSELFEHNWEESVRDGMRPGAVWMATFAASKPYDWPCLDRGPFRGVWVKPLDRITRAGDRQTLVTVP